MQVSLWLVAAMAISGCGASRPLSPTADGAPTVEPDSIAAESASMVRQGPFQVTCYKDETVVFEHGTIYRVFRPEGADAGWSYETGDGLKFRGRIGENVNCVWQSR